jgi:hypothetical protein
MDIENLIRSKLMDLKTPEEFAEAINVLGMDLMESGQLDSDELIWECARQMWKDMGDDFEDQVSDEFDLLLEE